MKRASRSRVILHTSLGVALGALMFAVPAAAQKQGGTLTVGLETDIPGFDHLRVGVYATAAETAAGAMFDTLTTLDDEGAPQPRLALSWTHADDFKTWTFKLRPGVKFQDGTPFNAAAVAFNYQRMLDPANHCRCLFYISGYERVEAADELTAVFHLKY